MVDRLPRNACTIAVNRDAKRLSMEPDVQHRILLEEISAVDERGDLLPVGKNDEQTVMQRHWPELEALLCDTDDVCLLAGLGGATGSWASPVIVHKLKTMSKRIVMVVVKPFDFERRRLRIADDAMNSFKTVDYLVVASNQQLMYGSNPDDSLDEAFTRMDKLIYEAWSLIEQGILETGHYRIVATGHQIDGAYHPLATAGFALNRISA